MRHEFLGIFLDFEVGRYGLDFARTEQGTVKYVKTSSRAPAPSGEPTLFRAASSDVRGSQRLVGLL
jgi:hypothetical protein